MKKKLKPSAGDWTILRGNYDSYATINVGPTKRICTITIPEKGEYSGLAPIEEAEANIKILGAAKENYEALVLIQKEITKAMEKHIIQGKRVNFKLLAGQICDLVCEKIVNTTNK
ncbi:MAG: hypothetical protein IT215_01145 [Chitinophagaceae bacterium]|nr:hypothetical protein [Chitinophagaceae bacterium]